METNQKETENRLQKDIWDIMKPLKMELSLPDPMNCAEPHLTTALARWNEIIDFPKIRREDIRYMVTYKSRELTPFQRCRHCVISTAYVRNVLTDIAWTNKVNILKEKADKLSYFRPFSEIQAKTNQSNDDNVRQRRSVDEPSWTSWLSSNISAAFGRFKNLLPDSSGHQHSQSVGIDVNSSLLLIHVIVRKITGRKFISSTGNMAESCAKLCAVNVASKLETWLNFSSGQKADELIDFGQMQSRIFRCFINGDTSSVENGIRSCLRNLPEEFKIDIPSKRYEFQKWLRDC